MSMLNVFDSFSSKVLLGLAIFLIAGCQYLFWFGEGGYYEHQGLIQKTQQQTELITELKERNRVLAAEVYDLKNGIEAIEEHARLDLGLIKPHETFVQMSTISTQYKPVYVTPKSEDQSSDEPLPEIQP